MHLANERFVLVLEMCIGSFEGDLERGVEIPGM